MPGTGPIMPQFGATIADNFHSGKLSSALLTLNFARTPMPKVEFRSRCVLPETMTKERIKTYYITHPVRLSNDSHNV